MDKKGLTVAVTGLNATDNPAPGVGVIRALRGAPGIARTIGLAYDALDPGIYAADLIPDAFMLPYPAHGLDAFRARLRYIHDCVGLDVIIPTLDSELPGFIEMQPELADMGIRLFLPTRDQLDLRQKTTLAQLGERAGIPVPQTAVVSSVEELYRVPGRVPFPFFVKGVFYGATLATNLDEAAAAFYKFVAQWGVPVIVQTLISGEEFNVVAVGDGEGGLVGAVAMKKMMITDKGKGWAGITVKDPPLLDLTASFMRATRWRGPCEIEAIRDKQGNYHLIEVNPRFPAWVYLAVAAGQNLPAAVVSLAVGERVSFSDYEVGTMFVRISLDQVAHIRDFQSMVTTGQVVRSEEQQP
jgi:carbamoyl-phosphate synthase large subunit